MADTEYPSNYEMIARVVDLDGRRVVDVGSGAGGLVRWLSEQGADAVGVECGSFMQAEAQAADPDHPERYIDGVGQDLPFDDDSVDVVVMSYSLHHIPADEMTNALAEAHRVLRPGGHYLSLEPVPAGPGFEVVRPVDDETYVRGLAQQALDGAEALGLTPVNDTSYETGKSYPDFAAWEKNMVGIDPERAAAMEAHRDEVEQLFHANAIERDEGYWFATEVKLRLFRAS